MREDGHVPPYYVAVVAALPDAVLLYRDGRVVHANPAAVHGLGADDLHRLLDADLRHLVAEDEQDEVIACVLQAARGEPVPAARFQLRDLAGRTLVASCSFTGLDLDGQRSVQVLARDVTQRAGAEQALAQQEAQFRSVFDSSPVPMAFVAEDRTLARVNDALCRMLARTADELVGRSIDPFTHPDDLHVNQQVRADTASGKVLRAEKRYLRPDGTVVWGELTVVALEGLPGLRSVVQVRDVTEQRLAREQLQQVAWHDPLTGLGNRALLLDRLERARRLVGATDLALLFIDLDGFKRVNDGFSHAVGDRLLATVGRRLRDAVRPQDTVVRWGGDEFLVLVDDLPDRETAVLLGQRIERAVAVPFPHRGDELVVTASVGIAFSEAGDRLGADELIRNADAAMYRAKSEGKSRLSVFDAALKDAAARRTHLERLLRTAAADGRVVLHYQPIVELLHGRVVGAEALLRLLDDDGSLLYPDAFLDVGEEAGLMVPLGHEVLRMACAQAVAWHAAGHDLTLSVNVCARQLTEIDDFERVLGRVLDDTGLRADHLVCELTEHAVLDITQRTLDGMRRLRETGVQFSVDDYGTGFGSMTYLRTLPVQEIKIDRSFVADAPHERAAAAIVRSVATLAAELGVRCVAEGVEDSAQRDLLVAMGVELAQGYLFGRPVPPESFPLALAGRQE